MKNQRKRARSNCPVNFALESFGDNWSLLIVRDIVFWGKRTFKDFLESKEGIASNILSSRLSHLVKRDILTKEVDPRDKRVSIYRLTEKGLDLIPMLLEMSGWASRHDPKTTAPKDFVEHVYANREPMFKLIRETVRNGGSLFAGENSVINKLGEKRKQD